MWIDHVVQVQSQSGHIGDKGSCHAFYRVIEKNATRGLRRPRPDAEDKAIVCLPGINDHSYE